MTERNNTCVASAMQRQTENFFKLASMVHEGSNLDFSSVKFKGFDSFIKINCKVHGKTQMVARQVLGGRGCNGCRLQDYFNKEAKSKFGDKYDISKVVFKSLEDFVEIGCDVHGFVKQQAASFLRIGCKECNPKNRGTSKRKYAETCLKRHGNKSNFYIIKCYSDSEVFYKIGISASGIETRYGSGRIPYKYEVIKTIGGMASEIWELEKQAHRALSRHKYKPNKYFAGHTECFKTIKPLDKIDWFTGDLFS